MTLQTKPVYSSWVDEIGYDDETRIFTVRYQRGGITMYSDVPPEKARAVWEAPSVGEALHQHIRGQHEFKTI